MIDKHALDLGARNILPGSPDHILESTHQAEVSLVVAHGQIPGMEPAVPDRLCSGFRLSPVTEHHGLALDHQLARLACRRHVTVLIDDPHLLTGKGITEGAGTRVLVIIESDNQVTSGLGHTEGLAPRHVPAALEEFVMLGVDARAVHHPELVLLFQFRILVLIEQVVGHGADHVDKGDAVIAHRLPETGRRESLCDDQRDTVDQTENSIPLWIHVIKGLHRQVHIIGPHPGDLRQLRAQQ